MMQFQSTLCLFRTELWDVVNQFHHYIFATAQIPNKEGWRTFVCWIFEERYVPNVVMLQYTLLKFSLEKDNDLWPLYSQYHDCW